MLNFMTILTLVLAGFYFPWVFLGVTLLLVVTLAVSTLHGVDRYDEE